MSTEREVLKLTRIEGVGREKAERLCAEFGDAKETRDTPAVSLQQVHGIGRILSMRLSNQQSALLDFEEKAK